MVEAIVKERDESKQKGAATTPALTAKGDKRASDKSLSDSIKGLDNLISWANRHIYMQNPVFWTQGGET